jgi:hypothetical protein
MSVVPRLSCLLIGGNSRGDARSWRSVSWVKIASSCHERNWPVSATAKSPCLIWLRWTVKARPPPPPPVPVLRQRYLVLDHRVHLVGDWVPVELAQRAVALHPVGQAVSRPWAPIVLTLTPVHRCDSSSVKAGCALLWQSPTPISCLWWKAAAKWPPSRWWALRAPRRWKWQPVPTA